MFRGQWVTDGHMTVKCHTFDVYVDMVLWDSQFCSHVMGHDFDQSHSHILVHDTTVNGENLFYL